MLKLLLNNADVTDYLDDGSLSISDQIQNKADTCNFSMRPGVTQPQENQDVKIYDAVTLVSASGTAVVVNDTLASGLSILDYMKFRVGQYFWLGINHASEERVLISAIAAGTTGRVNITLVTAIVSAHSAGQTCGKLIFGGTLTYVKQSNPRLLTDVEYDCSATDYTKIFDKKNINDSWEDVDARTIINDFCDTTINYNKELDDMDYADNAAVQAEWIETNDGANPTRDATNVIQGTNAVNFSWTFAAGTATFSATPASQDLSDLTGAASGAPTKGNVTFWYKRAAATGITTLRVRVGSDASNYVLVSVTPEADTDQHFISLPLDKGTVTGTPVWTAADYLVVQIVETASTNVTIDDIRITADGSFTLYNVEPSVVLDDARAAFKKPTVFINQLAKALGFYWFIDYEKDIHFFDEETQTAPFNLNDTSDNFDKLVVDIDTAQLKNRQVVRGGTKISTSVYQQVVQGDNAVREWVLKTQFVGLTIKLDDNTSTDACEAGTTTTNIKATTHGLATGDYIINRTRSNAVRKITLVDADNFTVEAVTSQTSGDTFSKFATTKTDGVEYLDAEASFDYMYNFNEKSVRASTQTVTLPSTSFLLFSYNEIVPIRIQLSDYASIAAMKTAVGGDGIFDGAVITDQSLDSTQAAINRAQAEIDQFSNPLVKVSFKTDYEGLEAGQLIRVTDTSKGIDDEYLIQTVRTRYQSLDFPSFDVQCASSLFGIIEYLQKLSEAIGEKLIDEDDVIEQIVSENEEIIISEVNVFTPSESASESVTITITPSDSAADRNMTTTPFKWQPDANTTKWNLFQWG